MDAMDIFGQEKIKGTIKLNLKKPMNARKLEVSLIGKQKMIR